MTTSRRVHRLLPMALTVALAAASVATATAAGAAPSAGAPSAGAAPSASRPAAHGSLRASALHDLDSPLAAQVRARAKTGAITSTAGTARAAGAAPMVGLRHSKQFLAALATPTLVFTRLTTAANVNAFTIQSKNLLTGVVANLLPVSISDCPISPRQSPDGTLVAYIDYGSQCTGNGVLEILNVATAAITPVVDATSTPNTYLTLPNWSPDSATVLYTDETDDPTTGFFVDSALFTVPAAGGPPAAAGGAPGAHAYGGVFSPDGTKIVFAPTLPNSNSFLAVMPSNGSTVTPLTHTILNSLYWPDHAAWSPDGTKVSFTYVKYHTTYQGQDVFINGIGVAAVDDSSGGGLAVTSASRFSAFYSSWSADGTQIYFDLLLRDTVTGNNLINAGVYATDAGGTRRATLAADGNNAYDGVSFTGPSIATGSASTYTPLPTPVRVLPKMLLGPGASTDVQMTGVDTIPAGATAVTLNLTGVTPTTSTYLQAYPTPADSSFPLVSNLNLVPGQISAVAVQVALSATGAVRIRNAVGTTGVVVDVSGYFTAGTGADQYVPITPVRAIDTHLAVGGTVDVTVTGHDPANPGLTPVAVVLNLTGASPDHATYLQAYPTQTTGPPPTISNLNLATHEIRANLVTVGLGVGNTVTLRNAFGNIRAIADVVGYYYTTATATGGLSYYPLQPTRFLDTRYGTDTQFGSVAPLGPGSITAIGMRGTATTTSGIITVPTTAQAYVYNLTAVAPSTYTYLTAYPLGPNRPLASNVNAFAGTVVPCLAITGADGSGQFDMFNFAGHTPVIIDLSGYYAP